MIRTGQPINRADFKLITKVHHPFSVSFEVALDHPLGDPRRFPSPARCLPHRGLVRLEPRPCRWTSLPTRR
jgi:hypothetical protein